MTLYMKVTKDKYELPIAVAGSTKELALMLGVSPNCVSSCFAKKYPSWKKVEIEDEEDNHGDNPGRSEKMLPV